ncbi:DUF21 domain-containing protein At4g33700-like [Camellia sinensis]|uniref:DUF21 domain-containing protein At4g33700-like n=1 Tax=Camellia sinensis TaxID=4442 RepID=UPI001036ED0C|nr:DUF21 domain-containing protein At4g33700-like [Camellia sinensis]
MLKQAIFNNMYREVLDVFRCSFCQTLPIFLDSLVTAWGAILISVTLILLFGEAGKGGELTHDETTIIAGALGLTEKTASDAMTPISDTFAVDINAKLDRELMNLILEKGHRRVPVYYEQPTNIIGLVLSELENLSFMYSNAQALLIVLGKQNFNEED